MPGGVCGRFCWDSSLRPAVLSAYLCWWGPARAKPLSFTGRTISGVEAGEGVWQTKLPQRIGCWTRRDGGPTSCWSSAAGAACSQTGRSRRGCGTGSTPVCGWSRCCSRCWSPPQGRRNGTGVVRCRRAGAGAVARTVTSIARAGSSGSNASPCTTGRRGKSSPLGRVCRVVDDNCATPPFIAHARVGRHALDQGGERHTAARRFRPRERFRAAETAA